MTRKKAGSFTAEDLHKLRYRWKVDPELAAKAAGIFMAWGSYEDLSQLIFYHERYGTVLRYNGAIYCVDSLKQLDPSEDIICSFRLLQHGYPGFVMLKSVSKVEGQLAASGNKL